jgi:hypothetical protein
VLDVEPAVDELPDSADESAELEAEVCAHAAAGAVAIPNPTPSATANPPTRPMYLASRITVPLWLLPPTFLQQCDSPRLPPPNGK